MRGGATQFMKWRWAQFGSLYGDDGPERLELRDECEAHGIPMGYGRVGKAPTQLDDEYLTALFELNQRGE